MERESNKKLIVFGEDWGQFPSSTQSLFTVLLEHGWQVIWINSIGMRQPSLDFSYLCRIFKKLTQFFKSKISWYSLPNNLVVVNPIIFPFIGYSIFDMLNRYIFKKQLYRKVYQKGVNNFIVWVTIPTAYPLLKVFNSSPIVYYCCDDYAGLGKKLNPKIPYFERMLSEEASLIFYVSDILGQKFPENKKIFLDHGIDVDLFTQSYQRPEDLPLGKPIAGFYGSISHWVDLELIYECAIQLRHWNFVLIGPKNITLKKLEQLDNVFYLGIKPQESIPAYSQHWNVGMIPFIRSDLIDACNPLKIKEYLLTGNPVVSIDIPALQVYKKNIYIAKNNQDFIRGIELSLQDKNDEVRKNLVKNQSWDNRAQIVEEKLLQIN